MSEICSCPPGASAAQAGAKEEKADPQPVQSMSLPELPVLSQVLTSRYEERYGSSIKEREAGPSADARVRKALIAGITIGAAIGAAITALLMVLFGHH